MESLQSDVHVTSNIDTEYNVSVGGFLVVHAQKASLGIILVSRPTTNTSTLGTDSSRSNTWHRSTLEVDL